MKRSYERFWRGDGVTAEIFLTERCSHCNQPTGGSKKVVEVVFTEKLHPDEMNATAEAIIVGLNTRETYEKSKEYTLTCDSCGRKYRVNRPWMGMPLCYECNPARDEMFAAYITK
jgi:hypothetical protein